MNLSNPTSLQNLSPEAAEIRGQVNTLYGKVVRCETRTKLLIELQRLKIGTPEVESLVRSLFPKSEVQFHDNRNVKTLRIKTRETIVRVALGDKIRDSSNELRTLKRKYWSKRNKLFKILGNKSVYKRIIDRIRQNGTGIRICMMEKNTGKIDHLRSKYSNGNGSTTKLPDKYCNIYKDKVSNTASLSQLRVVDTPASNVGDSTMPIHISTSNMENNKTSHSTVQPTPDGNSLCNNILCVSSNVIGVQKKQKENNKKMYKIKPKKCKKMIKTNNKIQRNNTIEGKKEKKEEKKKKKKRERKKKRKNDKIETKI